MLCSKEVIMKKLGDLMNESHASYSLLYECKSASLSLNNCELSLHFV